MGWTTGGTNIFDRVAGEVIGNEIPVIHQVRIVKALLDSLRGEDWDDEEGSEFYDHPVFITAQFLLDGGVTRYDDNWDGIDVSDKVLGDIVKEIRQTYPD